MDKRERGLSSYYRKSAFVIRIVRFALLLAFVVFAIYCIGFFSSNLTEDSVKSVWNSIYRSFTDLTPSETEIAIESDDSSSFVMMNNDLAVVSNNKIDLYSFSGDKLLEYEYTYSDAAAVASDNRILVYDEKGDSFALYSTVAKLYSGKLEYGVKTACINDDGYFAVVSSEKTYRSGVIIYGPTEKDRDKYEEKFKWMSHDKYILSVAISNDSSELLSAAVYNKDGAFETKLVAHDIKTAKEKYSVTLPDTMVMKLGYTKGGDGIYALADGRFFCFDTKLKEKGVMEFSRSNAKLFKQTDEAFVVAESNNLSGSSMTVFAYGYDGKTLLELKTEEKVIEADYFGSKLFVLYKDKMVVYNGVNGIAKEAAVLPMDVQSRAVRTDGYGRYILVSAKNVKRGTLEKLIADSKKSDYEKVS